ncbi:hypothetical protein C943_01615 [Mariniradius saccharolyticus AK6]|uniref:Uncharacterized protein n=1 Tax=Mariniradius saccharolyticus AK6 TaxID=1239962 RepID=M7X3I7_9BACT|nr:hypothetical protein C943_01615 [Mariniradius saccharolyticus AK6]
MKKSQSAENEKNVEELDGKADKKQNPQNFYKHSQAIEGQI